MADDRNNFHRLTGSASRRGVDDHPPLVAKPAMLFAAAEAPDSDKATMGKSSGGQEPQQVKGNNLRGWRGPESSGALSRIKPGGRVGNRRRGPGRREKSIFVRAAGPSMLGEGRPKDYIGGPERRTRR